MVANLVCNHVCIGEFTRSSELPAELPEKGEVQIDFLIRRTIKRPDGSRIESAGRADSVTKKHECWRLILLPCSGENFGPRIFGTSEHSPHKLPRGIVCVGRRAWRRVGLALDRIGFVVEDRDRAGGIYFVRYADPEANTKKDKGFLSKLAFWSSDDDKAKALRYQVRLKGTEENTVLAVYMDDGSPADNETGKRIVSLLFEQLK